MLDNTFLSSSMTFFIRLKRSWIINCNLTSNLFSDKAAQCSLNLNIACSKIWLNELVTFSHKPCFKVSKTLTEKYATYLLKNSVDDCLTIMTCDKIYRLLFDYSNCFRSMKLIHIYSMNFIFTVHEHETIECYCISTPQQSTFIRAFLQRRLGTSKSTNTTCKFHRLIFSHNRIALFEYINSPKKK